MLLDIDGEGLKRTAETVSRRGRHPLTLAVDATEEQPVEESFSRIVAAHGQINVLVNDVGGSRNMKLWEMTAEAWDFTIKLSPKASYVTGTTLPVAGGR